MRIGLLVVVCCCYCQLAAAELLRVGFGTHKPPYIFEGEPRGLEYELVFLPFICTAKPVDGKRLPLGWHDESGAAQLTLSPTDEQIAMADDERLAEDLGLTFQQVQKYEGGSNRISASKLHATAMFLKTPIGFFFEGLDDPEEADTTAADLANEMAAFWSQPGGPELARSYLAIPSTGMRKHLVDLAKAIAGEE